jgi:hypothetical protein
MKLDEPVYEQAQRLVADRSVVLESSDDWSEHRPSMREEHGFIQEHGSASSHAVLGDQRGAAGGKQEAPQVRLP